jgi:FMN phosphatase YigB (HAD superfamily)
MIGDDWEADVLGARDAGMDQAYLTSTDDMLQEFGHRGESDRRRHNHTPTFTLGTLGELIPHL